MAVLEDVPGIEVVVQVAGRDAIEYEDPNASERETRDATCPTSTKYIECIDGAEFSIRTTITNAYQWGHNKNGVDLRLRVDGNAIYGSVLMARDMINGVVTKIKKGQKSYCTRINKWVLQRFKFSAVDVVDDSKKDRIEDDIKIAKHLGLIEVRIFRCIPLGSRPAAMMRPTFKQGDKLELAEKSLKGKAISHGTSLSSRECVPAPRPCKVMYPDGLNNPIAVFQFHYRSRGMTDKYELNQNGIYMANFPDALKREMVIPRTPSPGPGLKREVTQMSRAELEQLARERLDQLKSIENIKEERKPAIKREFGGIIDLSEEVKQPIKFSRPVLMVPNEVIDLTDD
ncbi:hypothetical protein F4774DRAFT_104262 [Daldinia eschscholtzii]|nr:hypothetical protein F4774DRAFT_104262 [Daldinia eschscholtzii]